MIDFEARRVIEALRSGISSRAVGHYFSSARPKIMNEIAKALDNTVENRNPGGMIITGKYGEGKTHLLNTVFNMAHERNMVVSLVSLSKETPFDKLYHVYQKIVQGTYLPGRLQPGFGHIFETMAPKSPVSADLLEYVLRNLETDRLYYLLKSYLGTEDDEEKFMLLADLEGDFTTNGILKKIYKRIFSEKFAYNTNFTKTKHTTDYFAFLSRFFSVLGYLGWVILFDEAELIGRLSKKARLNAYLNMSKFLFPGPRSKLEAVYSFFAFNASFVPDVIESKNEFENLDASLLIPDDRVNVKNVLNAISSSSQLVPLNESEIMHIIEKIRDFHAKAYDWVPNIDINSVFTATEKSGYLLRTRIRTAVELLDQHYQYKTAGNITVNELEQTKFGEDDALLSLESLLEEGVSF